MIRKEIKQLAAETCNICKRKRREAKEAALIEGKKRLRKRFPV